MNIDGLSICEKSNLSVWTCYIAINELEIEERFLIDNIVVLGISVGYAKPKIDDFMNHIKTEMIALAIGFECDKIRYQFHLLFGTYDKPARSLFVNIVNSNGYSSCIKCQQVGQFIPFGNGFHHVFNFDEQIVETIRTKENYQEDLLNLGNGISDYDLNYSNLLIFILMIVYRNQRRMFFRRTRTLSSNNLFID